MNQDKIGKFIAKIRKENNMTQEQLAEKLGVNSRSISRWENGRTMPDYSLLVPLSKELGISVNDLLSGKKNNRDNYENVFEENIINIASQMNYDNKKRKWKTLWVMLSIVFIMPLVVLCIGQFFKLYYFPSFSSLNITNKANQFYKALKSDDFEKIDKLITNDVKEEMCWLTEDDYQSRQNFLDNLKILKEFKYKVEYTSFRLKQFYYHTSNVIGSAWEYGDDSNNPDTLSVSSCSKPSRSGFIVKYELCFKDRLEKGCIILDFMLDDDGKLIFIADSKDINLRDDIAYKKYYPIYSLLPNNSIYNVVHLLVNDVFYGFKLENIEENIDSWLSK